MKHSDYWRGRFESLEESLLQHGADYYADLEREFRAAARNIEKDIAAWYQRLAQNNEICYAEAKKLLSADELAEFHWDVEEYIKRGQENAIDQRWKKQLENASAKVHISRLEAMKLQLQQHAEVLYGNHLDGLDRAMRAVYGEGYYHTAFEIQRGLSVGRTLHQLDERRVAAVLAKPWAADGKNFSDRIWTDKTKLIHTLHSELTQATIRGDPPDQVIKTLKEKMKVSQNAAGRLVMTETAFFASASQRDCFSDLGVKQYEIVATLDSRTSPICREMDGKVFAMADYKPGVTAPPFHCWCRSVSAPHFADEKGARAARGEDGKTYYVPGSMKYPEWKKKFVDKSIVSDTKIECFQKVYQRNGKDIQQFAQAIVSEEGLPLQVKRHPLKSAFGQCALDMHQPEMKVATYELNSDDVRPLEYQIKTAFHELFHAKSHLLEHDIQKITFAQWAYVDDIFAESTAHYLTKSMGITKEIAPSYARYLVEALPKLKKLPEFSKCQTIADFGEIAYQYRFSNQATAKWSEMSNYLNGLKHDIINYGKQYIQYIADHKNELVDKMLENMPEYKKYRLNMLNDLDELVERIIQGRPLTQNQTIVFHNVLAITMNRVGVK